MDKARMETLRYLGHRGQELTPELETMLDECMLLLRKSVSPVSVYKRFRLECVQGKLALQNTSLFLEGEDIKHFLSGCTETVLFALTLGIEADRLIRRFEGTDITRALVLDACATQYVEECCDVLEEEIRAQAFSEGLGITGRFSPGYGDLPLEMQPELLRVLGTDKKLGLSCGESLIMLPRKSVTAIIGIGVSGGTSAGCSDCTLSGSCTYRKEK